MFLAQPILLWFWVFFKYIPIIIITDRSGKLCTLNKGIAQMLSVLIPLVDVTTLWPSSLLQENSHYSCVLLIYLISSYLPTTGKPVTEPSA